MEKINLYSLIIVAVVAIVAIFMLLGGIPAVSDDLAGEAFKERLTFRTMIKQDVLKMLGSCVEVEPSEEHNLWCSATCQAEGKTVLGFFTYVSYVEEYDDNKRDFETFSVFNLGDSQLMPSCREGSVSCARQTEELMQLEEFHGTETFALDTMEIISRCICCSP